MTRDGACQRSIRPRPTAEADHRLIRSANRNVHGGDVKFDAELYLIIATEVEETSWPLGRSLYGPGPFDAQQTGTLAFSLILTVYVPDI